MKKESIVAGTIIAKVLPALEAPPRSARMGLNVHLGDAPLDLQESLSPSRTVLIHSILESGRTAATAGLV